MIPTSPSIGLSHAQPIVSLPYRKEGQKQQLLLQYSIDRGLHAYLVTRQEGKHLYEQGEVEFPDLTLRFKQWLFNLSPEKRTCYFKEQLFLEIKRCSTGEFVVRIRPKLLGGGSCQSAPVRQSPPVAYTQASPANNSRASLPTTSPIPTQPTTTTAAAPASSTPLHYFRDNLLPISFQAPLHKALDQVNNTGELAFVLAELSPLDSHYPPLQELALRILELFAQKKNKAAHLIEEATRLAETGNTLISRSLLKILVTEISRQELFDSELLKALSHTLQHSRTEALDPDDLVQVLKLALKNLGLLHQQESTSPKLYSLLRTLSDLLDAMGDANLVDVKRLELHDPVYQVLDGLSHHDDLTIASAAAYAKQALVRVPNDESKLSMVIRRGTGVVQGFLSLAKVVTDKDISSLINAYGHFKEAAKSQEDQKPWHDQMRILKLLVDKGCFAGFQAFALKEVNDTTHPYLVGNLLGLLCEIVSDQPSVEIRQGSLNWIADLFLDDARWGKEKKVKKAILAKLLHFAGSPDKETRNYARQKLAELHSLAAAEGIAKQQAALIEAYLPDDLSAIPIRALRQAEATASTSLFTEAKRSNFLTLSQKILRLKELTLKNEEIEKELATYIPVLGCRELFSSAGKTFDLEEAAEAFLKGDQKVWLLMGDSGAGKSTFCRYLERKLWEKWEPGQPIPLFISLSGAKEPFQRLVQQALLEKGFEEKEIAELQKLPFLLFLDGFDELQKRGNLYRSNQLKDWQAKVIISCRTQHFSGEQISYRTYFIPQTGSEENSLHESAVVPFNRTQIDAYLKKYLNFHPTNWELERYLQMIDTIPGLSEMMESPFLLRITAEVLPGLVNRHAKHKAERQLHLARLDLYDAFTQRWFERAESKFIDRQLLTDLDIKKELLDFSRQLAGEMLKAGLVSVTYEEKRTSANNGQPNQWSRFFSERNTEISHLRSGVPLRKVGPYTYAFLHKSLLEYFGASHLSNQVNQVTKVQEEKKEELRPKEEKLELPEGPSLGLFNQKLFVDEPEVVQFFVEEVQRSQLLQAKLWAIVEGSKTKPELALAAANAITILNAAGFALSLRDLSGIRIPGADLSHALLDSTNLAGADLSRVRLNGAFLRNAQLSGCQMEGVEFAQRPSLIHPRPVSSIAVSPDGKYALSGSSDKTVRLWDLATQEMLCLKGHRDSVSSVAFSPDGKWILSGSSDDTVRLWDLDTGQEMLCLRGHTHNVTSVAFSPNGKRILSGSQDQTLRLWDLATGQEMLCLKGHTAMIHSVVFSPDDKLALSGSDNGIMGLWDLATGKEKRCLKRQINNVNSVAFSPDGQQVVSGSIDRTVLLWDLATWQVMLCLKGHTESITSIAFSPDGQQIVSGSDDKTVRLWDLATGQEMLCLKGHTDRVKSVAFSPDGKQVLSGSEDNTVRVWVLEDVKTQKKNKGHTKRVCSAAISSDGKQVLSVSWDATVRLWDLATGQEMLCLKRYTAAVLSVAFSPDDKLALSGSYDKTLRLWDLATGEEMLCLKEHTDAVESVAFSPDGKWVLSGSTDKTLRLWDLTTGQETLCLIGHTDLVISVAFSPDGKWVLSGSHDNTVRLWDLATGKETLCLRGHTDIVNSVAFSPNGKSVLSGGSDDTMRLWDLATGQEMLCLERHTGSINSVAFSPDGKWVLSGSYGTMHLWDLATAKEILCLKGHITDVNSVVFSPDGCSIISASDDYSIRHWQLFDQQGELHPTLVWSSSTTSLDVERLKINGVMGLSAMNRLLLQQNGAVEE